MKQPKIFDTWMHEAEAGRLEDLIRAVRQRYVTMSGDQKEWFRPWVAFMSANAHILRRGDEAWSAHKILLQLAMEQHRTSPISEQAEQWLRAGKCTWRWLRKVSVDDTQTGTFDSIGVPAIVMEHDYPDQPQFFGTVGVYGATALRNCMIASWGGTQTVRLWTADGDPVATLRGHSGSVHGLIECEDGDLISWSRRNDVFRWGRSGEIKQRYDTSSVPNESNCLETVLPAPGDRFVTYTTCGDGPRLSLWGTERQPLESFKAPNDNRSSYSPCFDPQFVRWAAEVLEVWGVPLHACGVLDRCIGDAKWGLIAWSGADARVYDLAGNPQAELSGHTDEILGASFLTEGTIITWASDCSVVVWSAEGQRLRTFTGHSDMVVHALSDALGIVWAWSFDGTLIRWDRAGNEVSRARTLTGCVLEALVTQDGSLVVWTSSGELLRYHNDGTVAAAFRGHTQRVMGAQQLEDGRLLSWSTDGTLRLWMPQHHAVEGAQGYLHCVGTPPECVEVDSPADEQYCTWAWRDPTIHLWTSAGKYITGIDTASEGVRRVWTVGRGDQSLLVAWLRDAGVRMYTLSGVPLSAIELASDEITAVAVSTAGVVVVGTEEGGVAVFDMQGQLQEAFAGHDDRVIECHVLPGGITVTFSRDCTIRIWRHNQKPGDGDCIKMPIRDFKMRVGAAGAIFAWSNRGVVYHLIDTGVSRKIDLGEYMVDAAFLSDGTAVSYSLSGSVYLWDTSGSLRAQFTPYPDLDEDDLMVVMCSESSFITVAPEAARLDRWASDGTHLETLPFDHYDSICGHREHQHHGVVGDAFWRHGDTSCSLIRNGREEARYYTEGEAAAWQLYHDGRAVLTDTHRGLSLVQLYDGASPVFLTEARS